MDSPLDIPTHPENQGRYYEGRKVFSNRFILKRKLGQGGMGQVWLALDVELGPDVALKFTSPELVGDTKAVADLRRAVTMGRDLTHPRIVRVFDFHCDAHEAAISMEYMPGKNLSEWQAATEKGFFEAEEAHGVIAAVCEALDHAHHVAKRSHRDIKPKNIMFDDQSGTVKLADFDIGRRLTDTFSRTTGREPSGSLPYMGPQQLLGENSRVQDDVYSLGAAVYELLTGTPPFYQGDIREQIKTVIPPSMAQRRADLLEQGNSPSVGDPIPAAWERAVAACLAKTREYRPASAGAFLAMLQSPAAESRPSAVQEPPVKSPAGHSRPARSAHKKNPLPWIMAACGVLALAAWGVAQIGKGKSAQGRDHSPSDSARQTEPIIQHDPSPAPLPVPVPSHVEKKQDTPALSPTQWKSLAAAGDAYAQALLARYYLIGNVDQPRDLPKARLWAEKSANLGHPLGLYLMGVLAESDSKVASLEDQKKLANPWYEKAVSAGFLVPPGERDAQWMERIAGAYWNGRGVEKDERKAVALCQKAADLGESGAMRSLGTFYERGKYGLAKDEKKAAELYQKAADAGDGLGMSCLGTFYENGKGGLPKDGKKALELYQKAADAGDEWGMYCLGLSYEYAKGGLAKDEKKAVELYQKAAEAGNGQSLTRLGIFYENGKGGLAKDEKKAVELYQKAADAGDGQGITSLGIFYENGKGGLAKDEKKAVELYLKAANLGNASGMNALGAAYGKGAGGQSKDEAEAIRWYRQAADLGDSFGMLNLGAFYQSGLGGLERDENEAFKWYQKSADLGNPIAMRNLGVCYENGQGAKKDETEAVKWFRKAADNGNTLGMISLANRYRDGKGLSKNEVEAVNLYRKAADLGDVIAYCPLGWMYEKGKGGLEQDYAEALKWYRKSAEAGCDGGQHNLGYMYWSGKGVPADKEEAVKWYRKAAEQGNVGSQKALGDYYKEKNTNKDRLEAIKCYRKAAEQGHAGSQLELGYYYGNEESRKDWLEAVQWYEKAAAAVEATDGEAELGLGWLYDPETAKLSNSTKAEQWYRKAAAKGSLKAMYNLGLMFEYGNGVGRNSAEAQKWYAKAAAGGHEGAKNKISDME
jgi:TPR repeat protein/serine/threonine protein kinase